MSNSQATLKDSIVAAIRTVFDPEIPVNIFELGLIYSIDIGEENNVTIQMTLTSPNCPVAERLPQQVKDKVAAVAGVNEASIEIVFDPPWTREMMSEAAQLELEMMGISGPAHLSKPKFTDVTLRRTNKRDSQS